MPEHSLLPVCRASCLLGSQSPPRSQEARHPFITLPLLTAVYSTRVPVSPRGHGSPSRMTDETM